MLHCTQLALPRKRPRVRDPSKLNPFVQVRFAGHTMSTMGYKGVSPHIDETLTFQDVRAAPGDYIDLAVRHRTGGTAAAKNLRSVRLGYVRVSFEDVMRATSGLKSTWSLLECESGSISCSLTWVSLAEEEKRAASFDAA